MIRSGTVFTDTRGQPVHAHGAGILLPASHPEGGDGRHFMVGTTQKQRVVRTFNGTQQEYWLSEAVNMYSSFDLEHWTFESRIFDNTSIPRHLLPSTEPAMFRIERPKVVYNRRTRRFVLYFHLDSVRFSLGMVGIATSSQAVGAYSFVTAFRPDGERSLDLTLFQEEDEAYLVRTVNNRYIGISRLAPDYLNTTGIVSRVPRSEAPAMWRDADGFYYLLASGLSAWEPNPAILFRAAPPLDGATWQRLGNPSRNNRTFNSQPTFVLPYTSAKLPGRQLLLYMGDRWNALDLRSERPRASFDPGSVSNASYVWLPLVRGLPGQRGCRGCARLTPNKPAYVMPRLVGVWGNALRWPVEDYLQNASVTTRGSLRRGARRAPSRGRLRNRTCV